ncbi:alpha/beta fold hydrolase [Neofamilia massiliensis]|uniref:alpha/beta fold hydrolase n=1 Tax=Neofamilia massiliensis TaxID=1673724 RepID=UPI001FA80B09|nr:alpha/beta hydrolase [Neofamilia massiliensis]
MDIYLWYNLLEEIMEKTIKDLKINYLDQGDFDNIAVFLHGWGASKETMVPIANLIKDRYRVVLIDLPGFGMSEEPKEVLNSYDYADYILDLIESLNITKASFFGHSFGGKISSIIAANHPEKVDKLILIDSAGLIPKRGISYYFKVYSYKAIKKFYKLLPIKNKEEKLENFKKSRGSDDYQNSSGIMRKIMVTVVNENIAEDLKKIKADTLLIWGEDDDATPLYLGKKFEQLIHKSGLVVLKNAGHFSYIDDYGTFSAVINSYM